LWNERNEENEEMKEMKRLSEKSALFAKTREGKRNPYSQKLP
jgi:hypothetical protein